MLCKGPPDVVRRSGGAEVLEDADGLHLLSLVAVHEREALLVRDFFLVPELRCSPVLAGRDPAVEIVEAIRHGLEQSQLPHPKRKRPAGPRPAKHEHSGEHLF